MRQRTDEEIERELLEGEAMETYSTIELVRMIAPVERVIAEAGLLMKPFASKAMGGLSKALAGRSPVRRKR